MNNTPFVCYYRISLDARVMLCEVSMRTLYFDCFSGISGDMAVASMIDLGVPDDVIRQGLAGLPLDGFRVHWPKTCKNGIRAVSFRVSESMEEEHPRHRTLPDIENLLIPSGLPADVLAMTLRVFRLLAETEGGIHGLPADQVRFHEVGAVDSLVDIVAAACCLSWLSPDRVVFSTLREGCGTVLCAHGVLPVPSPATLAILASCGAEVEFTRTQGEMITPTGAAIVAAFGDEYGSPCPPGRVMAVGYGAGDRDFGHPNVLRATMVEAPYVGAGTLDTVCVLESTMDDCTGETLGHAIDVLRESGFPECHLTPVHMKKGRPGINITVLCPPERETEAAEILFSHTATIGLRRALVTRHVMQRNTVYSRTPYGDIPIKVSRWGGVTKAKPEFDAVCSRAKAAGVTPEVVRSAAMTNFLEMEDFKSEEEVVEKDQHQAKPTQRVPGPQD